MKKYKKDYLLLLQGNFVSTFGAVIYSSAISYWVYKTTGSKALMSTLMSVTMFTKMFLSPLGGIFGDCHSRRKIIYLSDLILGLALITLSFLAFKGLLQLYQLIIVAFLSGVCSSLLNPSAASLLVDILPESEFVRGNALLNGGNSLIDLIGSTFSGALLMFFGVETMILLNGISYCLSSLSEWFISEYPTKNKKSESISFKTIFQQLKMGALKIYQEHNIRYLVQGMLLSSLFINGFFSLLLAYALENGMSVAQYGYLSGCFGVGSLLGLAFLSVVKVDKSHQKLVILSSFFVALLLLASGIYVAKFTISAILFIVSLALISVGNGLLNGVLMLKIPAENRALIFGCFTTTMSLGFIISALSYGFLAELIPLRILGVVGAFLALSVLYPLSKVEL